MNNRAGGEVSPQISEMGAITGLDSANFSLPNKSFNIKNDNAAEVTLEVNLSDMDKGTYISTKFEVGWNPEIVREIKMTSAGGDLKWGC
jgi:hypothetical protein